MYFLCFMLCALVCSIVHIFHISHWLAELLCCDCECVFCNSFVFYVYAFYFILWAVVSAGYPALLSSSYFERINDDDDDDVYWYLSLCFITGDACTFYMCNEILLTYLLTCLLTYSEIYTNATCHMPSWVHMYFYVCILLAQYCLLRL